MISVRLSQGVTVYFFIKVLKLTDHDFKLTTHG